MLLPLAEKFLELHDEDQSEFLQQAVTSPKLAPFRQFVSEDLLEDFFYYDYLQENSLVQYWVEDNQFIADSLADLPPQPRALAPRSEDRRVIGQWTERDRRRGQHIGFAPRLRR